MTTADDALTPRPEHRFTFGLWTVGNPGRDPFGGPTRAPLDPVDSVRKLAELGAWGISLHDEDLVPYGSSRRRARPDRRALQGRARGDRAGRRDGDDQPVRPARRSRTARSRPTTARVRRAAIGKAMRAIDLGAELDAEVYVFWGGREGTETGVAKDPRDALDRYREAINVLSDYVGRAGLRPALRDGAQAERAARRHLPADGRARAALHLHARPARHGRRQPRGRARDDGRAVVPPRDRAGAVGRQAVPRRPQRAADRPLRPGLPLRRRGPQGGVPARAAARARRLRRARATSTRTRTATRTPTACGTSRAAACARTSRWPRRRATSTALPEVQEALAAASTPELGEASTTAAPARRTR